MPRCSTGRITNLIILTGKLVYRQNWSRRTEINIRKFDCIQESGKLVPTTVVGRSRYCVSRGPRTTAGGQPYMNTDSRVGQFKTGWRDNGAERQSKNIRDGGWRGNWTRREETRTLQHIKMRLCSVLIKRLYTSRHSQWFTFDKPGLRKFMAAQTAENECHLAATDVKLWKKLF